MRYDIIDALVDLVSAESKMPSVIITADLAIDEIRKLLAENERLRESYDRCIRSDRQKTFEINVLVPENRALRAENEGLMPLAKLGKWVLDMREEDGYADLNAVEIQNKLVELKLLVGMVTESCGEGCNCAEYGDFPLTCFRMSDKAKVLDK